MPLTVAIDPEAPPEAVWGRIEARLGGGASSRAKAPAGWWERLALWRGIAAFASVAALSLAVLLTQPGPAQPPIVVVLNATGATADGAVVPATFVASVSGDGRTMVTRPVTQVNLQANRALELWALPGQGAPRSLGLVSTQGTTIVRRDRVLDGTTGFAVSLEPPGGSPTGAPTGPVLWMGRLQS